MIIIIIISCAWYDLFFMISYDLILHYFNDILI